MAVKSLTGQLNTPISKVNYGGGTTDSLKIYVDNSNMTITGEVIWGDILGTTSDKAYPGHLGKESYEKIMILTAALKEEIKRAENAESALSIDVKKDTSKALQDSENALTIVNEEVARATAVEESLRLTLLNELNKLIETEADLLSKINNEAQIRDTTDKLLKDQIDYILSNINNNVSGIDTLLQTEVERAKEAEAKLQEQIELEKVRAINSEVNLNNKIDTLDEALNSKITTIENKFPHIESDITDLNNKIDSEVSRLDSFDIQLGSQIRNHTENINTHTQQLNTLDAVVKNQSDELLSLTDKVNDNKDSISNIGINIDLLNVEVENTKSTIDAEVDRAAKVEADLLSLIEFQANKNSIQETQLVNLNSTINSHSTRITNLEFRTEELDTSIDNLTSNLSELESKVGDGTNSLSSDITYLKEKYNSLDDILETHEEVIDSHNTQLINFAVQQELDAQNINQINSILDDQGAHLTSLELVNNTTQNALTELSSKVDTQYTNVKDDIQVINDTLSEYQTDISQQQTQIVNLNEVQKGLQIDIDNLNIKHTELSDSVNNLTSSISTHEDSINTLDINLSNEITRANSQENLLLTQLQELERLRELDSIKLVNLETINQEQSITLDTHTEKLQELDNSLSTVTSQVEDINSDLENFKTEVKNTNENIIASNSDFDLRLDDHDIELGILNQVTTNNFARLQGLDESVNKHEHSIYHLTNDFNIHVKESTSKIDSLESNLNKEILRSTNVETSLQEQLDTSNDKIKDNYYELNTIIHNNIAQLRDEVNTQDQVLNTQIEELDEKVDTFNNNLNSTIIAQGANFNNSLTRLSNKVYEEIETLKSNDTQLRHQTVNLSNRVDDIEAELVDTFVEKLKLAEEDTFTYVYAANNTGDIQLPVTALPEADALVQRDSSGHINVPEQEVYEDANAIPNSYLKRQLETMNHSIEDKISSALNVKFIDGGNAPI